MSPSAGGGWLGWTTWHLGNWWSLWHIPQLKWLVCLRWWAMKLQHLQWRQTEPRCPLWRPSKLQRRMPRLVRKLEDPPIRSVRAAVMSPVNSSPVPTQSAPVWEPTEPAPEPTQWPPALLAPPWPPALPASPWHPCLPIPPGPLVVCCWCYVLPCLLSVPFHLVT